MLLIKSYPANNYLMNREKRILPDDPEKLKQIIESLEADYRLLEEKFKTLQRKFFGKSSEKLTPEDELQGRLFDEAEDGMPLEEETAQENEGQCVTKVKEYVRKKTGRKPLPVDLPREEVIHDLTEAEKKCPCCGEERKQIGSDETEELDIIPASIKVIRHVRLKYGPCGCDEFLNSGEAEIKKLQLQNV